MMQPSFAKVGTGLPAATVVRPNEYNINISFHLEVSISLVRLQQSSKRR